MAGKGKLARREKETQKRYGTKVLFVNMSDTDYYCEQTGKRLPRKGMIVEHNGKRYVNWKASEAAQIV